MTLDLEFASPDVVARAVSPFQEMGAYEILWSAPGTTFKSLAERFARHPGSLPSDFVPETDARECARLVKRQFDAARVGKFGVRVHGTGEYPDKLRDACAVQGALLQRVRIPRSNCRSGW